MDHNGSPNRSKIQKKPEKRHAKNDAEIRDRKKQSKDAFFAILDGFGRRCGGGGLPDTGIYRMMLS